MGITMRRLMPVKTGRISPRVLLTALGVSGALLVWMVYLQYGGNPTDALDYYSTNLAAPYPPGTFHFPYPPVAIQAMAPLLGLPFKAFVALLRAAELAALVLLTGPATIVALFLPPVAAEINAANINLLLAVAVVGGFRWPVLWSVLLVTKPSAGVILLWPLVRREWRPLAIAIAPAAIVSIVSFALQPHVWLDWLAYLPGYGDTPGWPFPIAIWPRLPVAIVLVIWGARSDRQWMAVLGTILAWPRLYFLSIALLVALLPPLAHAPLTARIRRLLDGTPRVRVESPRSNG
jgi:hypothetical protein